VHKNLGNMRFIMATFPIFSISNDLLQLLTSWKEQQRYELAKFGILSNPEQFVFTYIDTKGNINKPLHADYLNNKMKSIRKRHK
ncbi:ketohydroxyglutarate aldolase, partial [Streptococcus pneumoniae]|uniref:ketohydroxyglutarate aldolase n=1 Tax=Streptococcus pneumoniae TaxID=1313 RepID=UPI001E4EA258